MENASKALIMAASILLGVMIISVGVALFNSFGGFSKDIMTGIEETQVAEFNTQFLKFYGAIYNEKTEQTETIKLTAHDVVTLANLAQKNNVEHDVQDQNGRSINSYYVQIKVNKESSFEKLTEDKLTDFIQENNKTYETKNSENIQYFFIKSIEISDITGRVIYIEIQKL